MRLLRLVASPSLACGLIAVGARPKVPALQQSQQQVIPAADAEPTLLEKLSRRSKVFFAAGRMFVDIKVTQRKEKKIRRELGLTEEGDEDIHSVEELWNAAHERNAQLAFESICELQGFWIKVGQYLSSRADVMPPQYLKVLAKLQDSAPAKPFKDVMATLTEELGDAEVSEVFSFICPEPLSTASLAQVHRATLRADGRQVVIKAQHRGVGSLMRQDMENLKTILGVVSFFDKDFDFGPVVSEWTKEVLKELDFRTEAVNQEEVKALLERCQIQAIVPATCKGLVKERLLVMDFCEGFPIRDLKKLDHFGVDRELLIGRVCKSWDC